MHLFTPRLCRKKRCRTHFTFILQVVTATASAKRTNLLLPGRTGSKSGLSLGEFRESSLSIRFREVFVKNFRQAGAVILPELRVGRLFQSRDPVAVELVHGG